MMMITKNKKYKSFEEIENDLKILKLKKQIDMAYLKSNFSQLSDSLSVKNIVASSFSNIGLSFLNARKSRWIELILRYLINYFFQRKR